MENPSYKIFVPDNVAPVIIGFSQLPFHLGQESHVEVSNSLDAQTTRILGSTNLFPSNKIESSFVLCASP